MFDYFFTKVPTITGDTTERNTRVLGLINQFNGKIQLGFKLVFSDLFFLQIQSVINWDMKRIADKLRTDQLMTKSIMMTGMIPEPVNLFDLLACFMRYRVIDDKKTFADLSFLTVIQKQLDTIFGQLIVIPC